MTIFIAINITKISDISQLAYNYLQHAVILAKITKQLPTSNAQRRMLMKYLLSIILLAFTFITTTYAANMMTPVGTWVTVSDKTGQRTGKIQIYERNGIVYGKVLKILPGANRDPNARCDKCPDNFKDKPVVGLTFLW